MAEDIVVSVICNAYNHEPYIRECLESLVSQRTRFPIEILVHDDASSDGTAKVIREFAERCPGLVLPIYESENQYSRGNLHRIQHARARGRYIAYCEGDDLWTDPMKLQKQVAAMEAHPEVDICAHAAIRIDERGKRSAVAPREADCVIPADDVIRGGGYFVATSSLMARATLDAAMPGFRRRLTMDYTLQIHGALRGGMLYLKDSMSIYRYRTPGSWSAKHRSDLDRQRAHAIAACDMLACLDRETDGRYRQAIACRVERYRAEIAWCEFRQCLREGSYRAALADRYADCYRRLSPVKRLGLRVFARLPWASALYRAARKRARRSRGAEGST